MSKSDLEGCVITFEQTWNELERLENMLAARYKLYNRVRAQLIEMDRAGKLPEDEIVIQWRATYTSFLDWIKDDEKVSMGG